MEGEARRPDATDAHAVSAARRRQRGHAVGREGNRRRRRRVGQRVRHRRGAGHGDLVKALRQHVPGAAADRPRRQHALPRRAHRDAGPRPGVAGEVRRLCRLLGRPAAQARRRDGRGDRAARAVRAAERQALRAEPGERRDLHVHRAGLRRQSRTTSTRSISRRRRSATGRRAAAACGRGRGRRSARTARSTPAAATATTCPSSRSTGRR